MKQRSRRIPFFCALALAGGAWVVSVWWHRSMAPSALGEPHATRLSSAVPSPHQEPSAAPLPRTEMETAVARRPSATAVAAPANSSSGIAEGALMRQLRSALRNDPALAIVLAREGNRRFPGSSDAPERASILIHALAEQGLSSQARGEAEDMVNRYPDSAWVREVEQFTGARRHRNLRVGPNGELHYVDPAPPT